MSLPLYQKLKIKLPAQLDILRYDPVLLVYQGVIGCCLANVGTCTANLLCDLFGCQQVLKDLFPVLVYDPVQIHPSFHCFPLSLLNQGSSGRISP